MSRFLGQEFRTPLVDEHGIVTPPWQKIFATAGVLDLKGNNAVQGSFDWGGAGAALVADQGGSLELGPTTGKSKTPFIDFHFHDATDTQGAQDFSVRLIADGDGRLALIGRLGITALPVHANNAAAIAGGLIAGDLYRTGADPDPVCIVH